MIKALYLERDAIKILIENKSFQSSEFNESEILLQIIRGEITQGSFKELYFEELKGILYIYTRQSKNTQVLFIDYTHFNCLLTANKANTIIIFQKILRFAVRHFEKLANSVYERHIDKDYYAIFSNINSNPKHRVLVETAPLKERLLKRGKDFILVFNESQDEIELNPSYTLLRQSLEFTPDNFNKELIGDNESAQQTESLLELNLESSISNPASHLSLMDWQYALTSKQITFIQRPFKGAERLQGPAGTGKTLSLVLRTILQLNEASRNSSEIHVLFVVHSIATKKLIEDSFINNYPESHQYFDRQYSAQSVTITTLQEWCIESLGKNISESEYIDRDALDSKTYQQMLIEQAFEEFYNQDYSSFESLISQTLRTFLTSESKESIIETLQHEISVSIKGRACESLERYLELPSLLYSIPTENQFDKTVVYNIYNRYQSKLESINQFDSDDIILSSMAQLNTPILKRRRIRDGYDVCVIDETHLFNLNELSIFHFLLKSETDQPIVFSIDKSQAIGDRGNIDEDLAIGLGLQSETDEYKTIFRSSPDIMSIAYDVLASGASLFTKLENPTLETSEILTLTDIKKTITPKYILVNSLEELSSSAFQQIEEYTKMYDVKKDKTCIIACDNETLHACQRFAERQNKPVEILKRRGDSEILKSASRSSKIIITQADYVGGLEFDLVVIIGIDAGRVPPITNSSGLSSHYLSYAWHNRIYVSLTRAKFALILIGEKSNGPSPLLAKSISKGSFQLINFT